MAPWPALDARHSPPWWFFSLATLAAGCLIAACAGPAPSAATPAPAAITWERVDPIPDLRDGPGRIVDAGALLIGTGPGGPWISEDGRTWTKAQVDGPAGAVIADVAAGPAEDGPAFVGVGRTGAMTGYRPMALTSTDGRRWTAVASQPGFDPAPGYEQAQLNQVAAGQTGFVAAGTEWGTGGQRPFVLVSTDGQRWERTAEPLVGSGPRALVATDSGFLLAGAANAPAGQATHAAFWTSEDGRTWQPAPDNPAFANAEPQALAVGHGVVVAVGYRIVVFGGGSREGGLAPAAWTSTDGQGWEAATETPALAWWPAGRPTPAPGALEGTAMSAVASAREGFVAVGVRWGINPAAPPPPDGQPRITAQGVVWRSSAGVTWEMLPDDPLLPIGTSESTVSNGLTSVVARDGRVIAVGGTEADGILLFIGTPAATPAP